ncbi:MAG: recombinase family protein, partial [Lachnospiraceae bacterium]|nr:recombinase family protein [Lachnospiraceae bacterium]
ALSGKTDNRPSFQKMIHDSAKGQFQAVIMYTLDRFARNRYDSAVYKAKLRKNGVRLLYAKQPMPDTPEGIILESVLEGYAEYYSQNLARSIKRGLKDSALECRFLMPILGYKKGEDGKYAIDPVEAKTVREIFYKYDEGMSFAEIAKYCNDHGYKTSAGNSFRKSSLQTIIRNEKYTGVYIWNDVYIEGGMPQIIDKDLFERVNQKLNILRKRGALKKANENYLLSGKIYCGVCGKLMVGESGTSYNGRKYYYYKCSTRKSGGFCSKHTERKDDIEQIVLSVIKERVLTDETINIIADKATEIFNNNVADKSILASLEASLKDIETKTNNLLKAIEQGVMSEALSSRITDLESQKKLIEARIAKEKLKKPFLTKDKIINWMTLFKNGNINDTRFQQTLISVFLNSVYVFDNAEDTKIIINFNLSGQNTVKLSRSDIEGCTRLDCTNPNYCRWIAMCWDEVQNKNTLQ